MTRYWLVPLLLLLTACQSRDGYFGRVKKPTSKRLVFQNAEPASLDPQMQLNLVEAILEDSLYSSLVRLHPFTLEPTADIATHYERNAEATRFTFYLRGHRAPRGIKLANTDTMREQFRAGKIPEDLSRGHRAPPDNVPASWSDGKPVTAHDFVYSWRRLFDPRTAAPYAQQFTQIANSAEILAGKRPTSSLGVRAVDDWTLEVSLSRPSEFFLTLLDAAQFFVLPRQSIEAAAARGTPNSWTEPGQMVTSGPFALAEWRPYERVVVRKNPGYWEADLTGLDEIVFLPTVGNLLQVNLYRSGEADTLLVPAAYLPLLRNKPDHHEVPGIEVYFVALNTAKPPLDNVLVRYALNMATDKQQVAKLMNGGQRPARTYGIPTRDYRPPATVPVKIQGRVYDVSSYDPAGARELLRMAGFPDGRRKNGERLRISYLYSPSFAIAEDLTELLRRQWQDQLGLELAVDRAEPSQFSGLIGEGKYAGMAQYSWTAFTEPALFLDFFFSSNVEGGTFWKSDSFRKLVEDAKATVGPSVRSGKVTDADRMIMEGMPVIPLVHNSWDLMMKPYVKGLPCNAIWDFRFKYAWVETN